MNGKLAVVKHKGIINNVLYDLLNNPQIQVPINAPQLNLYKSSDGFRPEIRPFVHIKNIIIKNTVHLKIYAITGITYIVFGKITDDSITSILTEHKKITVLFDASVMSRIRLIIDGKYNAHFTIPETISQIAKF